MEIDPLACFTLLGHPARLNVFRLLMRRYPDAVPAGEIAVALDLKPSTLSVYLAALTQAGLLTQTRHGTSLRYRAELEAVRDVGRFLLQDCCRGRPDLCGAVTPARSAAPVPRLLFVCTGNSARSIMAEALLRTMAGGRFRACSAGTRPAAAVHPQALAMLRAHGHDLAGLHPKPVEVFRRGDSPAPDIVITVCDRAANEDCPVWAGGPVTGHWGLPDPADPAAADPGGAFARSYALLQDRIAAFLALCDSAADPAAWQRAVDAIARQRHAA